MSVSLSNPLIRSHLMTLEGHLGGIRPLYGRHLLITGSTGFFGRWLLALLDLLNETGAAIRVTALSRQPEFFLHQVPRYRTANWLTMLKGDIKTFTLHGDSPDFLLHAATDTSQAAQRDGLALFDTLVIGARHVLDIAVEHGIRRVLFTGSGAQYGRDTGAVPVAESTPMACDSALAGSAYGEGKRVQETLAALYAERFGTEVLLTRCFAFSGAGLPLTGHFALGNFIHDALYREAIVLNSTGEAVRSYLDGADLAVWLLTLLACGEAGATYNVGSDQPLSISDLAQRVQQRVAPQKNLQIGDSQGSTARYVPDIGKARALGLDVWTSLDSSIDLMAAWARGLGAEGQHGA
ncbi:NAD-dependent dehydratase [Pseudomonas sp. 8Z]|uniref:NAD-dependent epimerase/dehydratase family protein n=1 Tax=Pseudomonas sp. 8Z TaxID=2653166 RepID=UPI0012F2700F|nr:NAD(P)-dependent oxidoreductase [Pseudomonas sp. 8Z]VXC32147.1 NAD-dependent dehydratase [Pseudomonas sp. 8Z]